jgi:outer membrane protein OmpA-like peptidoglycan-associated protein
MLNQSNAAPLAFLVAGAALVTAATATSAQTATFLSDNSTECEIFRGLSKVVPAECAAEGDIPAYGHAGLGLTRGIKRLGADENTAMPVEQKNPPEELSIALMVQFEFDSYGLNQEAIDFLDRLANVINNDLMAQTHIRIEGHADATGSESYNLILSKRRAHTVRKYLIERHGIDSAKVRALGKGEADLYDSKNPNDGINRRVEFTALGG